MTIGNAVDYYRNLSRAVIRGSRLIYADATVEIYSIENRHAAWFWFADTKWCVKENPWFEDYLDHGPLILLFSCKRNRDYLMAPANGEFRNNRNKSVSLSRFVSEHPSSMQPLRSMGVYWHNHEVQGVWRDAIHYSKSTKRRMASNDA